VNVIRHDHIPADSNIKLVPRAIGIPHESVMHDLEPIDFGPVERAKRNEEDW
jgi:hypothetical protein